MLLDFFGLTNFRNICVANFGIVLCSLWSVFKSFSFGSNTHTYGNLKQYNELYPDIVRTLNECLYVDYFLLVVLIMMKMLTL